MRDSTIFRKTKETDIKLSICLDNDSDIKVSTGIGFFDHMLTAAAFHGSFSLSIDAVGDLEVDMHHTIEDVGIVLGQAFKEAIGDKKGINRFADGFLPMDESLAFCSLDISGRPYLVYNAEQLKNIVMPGFEACMAQEFFYAFAMNSGVTLHLNVEYGENPHHILEALFKAFGRALGSASKINGDKIKSTKGVL